MSRIILVTICCLMRLVCVAQVDPTDARPPMPPDYNQAWNDYRSHISQLERSALAPDRLSDTILRISKLYMEKDSSPTNEYYFDVATVLLETRSMRAVEFILRNITVNANKESVQPEFYNEISFLPFYFALFKELRKDDSDWLAIQIIGLVLSDYFLGDCELTSVEVQLISSLLPLTHFALKLNDHVQVIKSDSCLGENFGELIKSSKMRDPFKNKINRSVK